MTIAKMKKEMIAYRDYYGGDLIGVGDIENATTKEELKEILDRHTRYMEDMLSDAHSHLSKFKDKLGLRYS
jgi:hypothetical protein